MPRGSRAGVAAAQAVEFQLHGVADASMPHRRQVQHDQLGVDVRPSKLNSSTPIWWNWR